MRKQRYQRHVTKEKDPKRVNTDTSDQDRQLLNTQLKGLKMIWEDEEEEKPTKKGRSYNSMDQDVLDYQNNLKNWSASEAELTPEELEARQSKFGGQAYTEISQARLANPDSQSALKLAIDGSKVDMASSVEKELIAKYGEEEYHNYIAYSNENQVPVNKSKAFARIAAAVPAKSYSDDYFTKRGVNPEDYVSKDDVAKLHISKYTQKGKDFIDGVKLTPENTAQVTAKLAGKIKDANLPDEKSAELFGHLATKLATQERERERIAKATSAKLLSDFKSEVIPKIKDYTVLTDSDAKSAGNVAFVKNTQDLDDGKLTWTKFKNLPEGERASDAYQVKVNQKTTQEYTKILKSAGDSKNNYLFSIPKNIPNDADLAVEVTYNYFNERKKQDPDFTLDDARGELYSKTSDKPIQKLLADSHRDIEKLGLSKPEYVNLMKSEAGRTKLVQLGIKKVTNALNYSNIYKSSEEANEQTRSKSETPRTN